MSSPVQPPKGTRDFLPEDMVLRRRIIETIRECFVLFGFVEIDTPVFEYLELLSRKCGSDIEKEIYTFEDKAKRKLGLRFELTSPLGRYYSTNRNNLTKPFKRFAIGKVYRYENTQAGRYREFLQADADIIGSYSMNVELELLDLAIFTLNRLGLSNYEILINDRKILDGVIAAAGISTDKKDAALRALDKMSKIGEDGVLKEFIDNGISGQSFYSFLEFMNFSDADGSDVSRLESLKNKLVNSDVSENFKMLAIEGVDELSFLIGSANVAGLEGHIKFYPLLVRGLGYYTGPIFEIKSKDVNIGSFSAGGRYDNLVELYGARPEGACGISFGVERIIDIISSRKDGEYSERESSPVELYIVYLEDKERFFAYEVAGELRSRGISTEMCVSGKAVISKEIKYAEKKNIKYIALIGEKEGEARKITVKNLKLREEKFLTVEEVAILIQNNNP